MAVRYIRKSGSDSNGGTSPSDAWLTIGKALGASGIASGDTLYIGSGTYREAVTVAMTSPTAETQVIADVQGANTGDAGRVEWTAFTTDDVTTPSTSATLNLAGRDFLTFKHIDFIGGNKTSNGDTIDGATTTISTNITFEDCTFEGTTPNSSTPMIAVNNTSTNALVWTFRRCIFDPPQRGVAIGLVANASADYDANVQFENCLFLMCNREVGVRVTVSGSTNTFGGGGVDLRYCGYLGGGSLMSTNDASIADGANACTVEHCWGRNYGGQGLNANASGQITEDYNYWHAQSAHTNVTNGTNNIQNPTAVAKRRSLEFGQSWMHGTMGRMFGEPLGVPILGAHTAASSPPSVDLRNRIRPAGGNDADYAIGPLERHDTAISPGTTVGADAGSGYIEIVGVGDHDFDVPVDAAATVLNIKVKTSGYSGTNYPQMLLVNGGQCGVADQTINATSASASAYETLSTASFTPTAKGIVTVRLTNRSANGTGIAAFDTFSVS